MFPEPYNNDPSRRRDENGNVESWRIEAGSPNTLVRRGMTRDSIPRGTQIVVFGYRHRNGSNAANGRDVTLPDGRSLFLTSPGTQARRAATSRAEPLRERFVQGRREIRVRVFSASAGSALIAWATDT